MIHYIPFTYIPETFILPLTNLVGPISVLVPSLRLASAPMQAAVEQGGLRLEAPEGVDPDQLANAVKAFSQWADLHKGRTGDLTGMFQAGNAADGRESSANQIRTLINRFGGQTGDGQDTGSFQAALFLALAHQYDQQQEALDRDLGSFKALESQFGNILGESEEKTVPLGAVSLSSSMDGVDEGRGPYMVEQRVAAWARLAVGLLKQASCLVTTSQKVYEHLMSLVPEAQTIWSGRLAVPERTDQGAGSPLRLLLETFAEQDVSQDAAHAQLDQITDAAGRLHVALGVIPGQPPAELFETFVLKKKRDSSPTTAEDETAATLIVRFGLERAEG